MLGVDKIAMLSLLDSGVVARQTAPFESRALCAGLQRSAICRRRQRVFNDSVDMAARTNPKRTLGSKKRAAVAPARGSPQSVSQLLDSVQASLTPGLRERLVAMMDEARIAPEGRAAYLSSITGRAWQTTRRWISEDKPGLPDLLSTVLLSIRFDIDANWLLGLTKVKQFLPRSAPSSGGAALPPDSEWLRALAERLSERAAGCVPFVMQGDEMEPRIQKGAPILVDTSVTEIRGNGIYVLEYQGRTIVRLVENRIPDGLVLSCENKAYKETVLKDAQTVRKLGIRVLGKAELWLQVISA